MKTRPVELSSYKTPIKLIAAGLEPFHVDCAITVALKITDDSCKMDDSGRALFMELYDALPEYKSDYFDATVFEIITIGRNDPSAYVFGEIRILREAAMDMIGKPRMKEFKAMVRSQLREFQLQQKEIN